jgi:hypothetical protein
MSDSTFVLIAGFLPPHNERGRPPGALWHCYHFRPFIGLAPLEPGAETLENDGDDTGDQRETVKLCLHFD